MKYTREQGSAKVFCKVKNLVYIPKFLSFPAEPYPLEGGAGNDSPMSYVHPGRAGYSGYAGPLGLKFHVVPYLPMIFSHLPLNHVAVIFTSPRKYFLYTEFIFFFIF